MSISTVESRGQSGWGISQTPALGPPQCLQPKGSMGPGLAHSWVSPRALVHSLSEVEVTGLLDEVPVDLRRSHVRVRSVDSFINREQLLLRYPHLFRFCFQLHLNA